MNGDLQWEVRGGPSVDEPDEETYSVERGTTAEGNLEVAADRIWDYGLARVIENVLNFREGWNAVQPFLRDLGTSGIRRAGAPYKSPAQDG